MEFRILGPLEVDREGTALALGGVRPRALLAILLLNANQVVSVDRLVDDVWDGRPPESAVHAVQVYVSQLRSALAEDGTRIATRAPGYVLSVAAEELDLHRFERLLSVGRDALAAGRAADAASSIREALFLWRGPALAGLRLRGLRPDSGRASRSRARRREGRMEADLALGDHAAVMREIEGLVPRIRSGSVCGGS